MAQQHYKIDLKTALLTLNSRDQTRTVIGNTAGEAPSASERPSLVYCHNVMPTKQGIASIGYTQQIPPVAGAAGIFVDVRIIYSTSGDRAYLAFTSSGSAYVLDTTSTSWIKIASTFFELVDFDPTKVTVGTVNRVSYIFYSRSGAVTYNPVTKSFNPVGFTGLDIVNVLGVGGSSGYLLAYTSSALAWSSVLVPTDFIPDAVTGAGGASIADLKGNAEFATSTSEGLLIYSVANIVAATYTGNSKYPFKLREVPSSKGGISLDLVAHEANSEYQFVFSKAGLQTVRSTQAEVLLPEVTDFLTRGVIEDYDSDTDSFLYTSVSGTMNKKIKYIASRYLVISYAAGLETDIFEYAVVIDTALQKLGKLKIEHTDVFEYVANQAEVSRESIGLLLSTGAVHTVDFSADAEVIDAVAVLGKLQYVRTNWIQLLGVEAEDVEEDDEFSVNTLVSTTGKFADSVGEGYLGESSEGYRKYLFKAVGKNHRLSLKGKFNLSTLQVIYSVAGRR